jgi:SH3 domain
MGYDDNTGYNEGGYDEGGYDEGGYDEGAYNEGGYADESYQSLDHPGSQPPPPPTRDEEPSYVCTATVQYDFAATEPDQLSILAGCTINIIQRDDGMGNSDWWHAEYQGEIGYVPGVYLTENI